MHLQKGNLQRRRRHLALGSSALAAARILLRRADPNAVVWGGVRTLRVAFGRLFGLCDREDELYRSAARIFPELQSPFSFCKFESEVTALMSAARHGRIQAAEHSVLVGSESLRWILPLSASGRLLNCCSRTQQSQPTAEVSEALMHFGQLPSMGDLRHERN